jgi:phenylacetate-CoA ligase
MRNPFYKFIFKKYYTGNDAWKKLQELLDNESKSRQEIERLQEEKIKKLIKYAYKNCSYYKEKFDAKKIIPENITLENFNQLPILQKKDIKERLLDLKSSVIDEKNLTKTGTGGSTGVPTHFYLDRNFLSYVWALKVRNLMWTGWKIGEWDFRLWGSAFDVRPADIVREKIALHIKRIKVYPAFEISQKLIKKFISDIIRHRPTIIQGYNMPLVVVAKYILKHKITLGYKPRGVINCAETLFDPQRRLMEEAYGCKVFNRYGGRELSDVCHECQHGNMHINDDLVYVEIVDDNGNLVEPGKLGHILLTGLENFGMPFIRYKVEDMGILDDKNKQCPCGRPLRIMRSVIGRSQDILRLKDGKYLAGEFFPHLFKDFNIKKFQVIQEKVDEFRIKVVKDTGLSQEDILYLENKIKEYTENSSVIFDFVEDIENSASGKFRFTISKIN